MANTRGERDCHWLLVQTARQEVLLEVQKSEERFTRSLGRVIGVGSIYKRHNRLNLF